GILKGVIKLLYDSHIKKVTDKFFLLTHIPIKAFRIDEDPIYSTGYTNRLERIFHSKNIYERIIDLSRDRDKPMYILNESDNTYYISCSICPKNKFRGIFIIGPCSTDQYNDLNIPFKPVDLQPYFLTLIRSICSDYITYSVKGTDEEYSFHVRKAMDYIDSRYNDNISLNHVYEYLGINKSYFCSIFKNETGKTFTQFLNEKRIEKSKKLLREDNLSILDIALSVGFNNQNYYNIIFKR